MTFSVAVMKDVVNALGNITNILRSEMDISRMYPLLGYIVCMKKFGVSSVEELTNILHDEGSWLTFGLKSDAPVLSPDTIRRMMDKLCGLHIERNSHLCSVLDDFFRSIPADAPLLNAFDHRLEASGKTSGVLVPLPSKELVKLGYMLLGGKPGRVLDPFAGVGGFATSNVPYYEFHGVELSEDIKELGEIRMFLANVSGTASYLPNVESFKADRYTSMVTMPPFRMKITSPLDHTDTMSELVPFQIYMAEEDYVEEKMVCFVPTSFLSEPRGATADVRKEATEGHYIDTVVLLPSGLLYDTDIAISAILMSTDKHNSVRIIDARNAFVKDNIKTKTLDIDAVADMLEGSNDYCFNLSFEEIANNSYSWFMSKELKGEQTKKYPANYTVREFSDLAVNIIGEQDSSERKAHVASFQSLSKDLSSSLREMEHFPLTDCTERRYHKITEPVLLLSNRSELRPTYCNASTDNPIFVDTASVVCYRVSSDIHVGYLIKELSSCFLMTDGGPVARINRSYIEHLKIGFPSLEIQESIFKESVRAEKLAQARELGLQGVIDSMKADYINEVRMRKHDMRPHLRQIRSAIDVMELFQQQPHSTKEELGDVVEGIFSMIPQLRRAIDRLSSAIDHLSEEEAFGTPELLNISRYIYDFDVNLPIDADFDLTTYCDTKAMEECGLLKQVGTRPSGFKDYQLSVYQDEDEDGVAPAYVNIARSDLDRLFQNIIENAKTHGYDGTKESRPNIWIDLGVDADRKMFYIEFLNDGKPFPEGMTKERYGLPGEKAGAHAGTGQGGYIVKKIVQNYNGDYELISADDCTGVRIYLPYVNRYED